MGPDPLGACYVPSVTCNEDDLSSGAFHSVLGTWVQRFRVLGAFELQISSRFAGDDATLYKNSDTEWIKRVNVTTCPIERLNTLYCTTDALTESMARMIVMNSLSIICAK